MNLHEHHNPAAATLEAMYTVPLGLECVITSIIIANRDAAVDDEFWVSTAPAGAVDDVEQYEFYACDIPAKDAFAATVGITLNELDVVRVKSTNGTCSFSIFGVLRAKS